jgi:hypothetical protein
MHVRRAGQLVTRPLNCGVMRKLALIALVAGFQAHGNAAVLPQCEASLKAESLELLPLTAPRTEYNPQGSVVILFTVNADGTVSEVTFSDWKILPADDFMRDYLSKSVKAWRFPVRESACSGQQRITIELNEDA